MITKRINVDVILKIFILLGYAALFFTIIQKGKIILFVHPKIIPYLIFTILSMLLISALMLGDIFKQKKQKVKVHTYTIFLLPLILTFCIYFKSISLNIENFWDNFNVDNLINFDYFDNSKIKIEGNTIIINNDNFFNSVYEINDNYEIYEGKKVQIKGFVSTDKNCDIDEFLIARNLMLCCVADLSKIGLVAKYKKPEKLEQNIWYDFEGMIEFKKNDTKIKPIIIIKKFNKTKKPGNPYVYQN